MTPLALVGDEAERRDRKQEGSECREARVKGVARIFFHDGALFLPAKTPYDREMLFEHLDLYAKRHGSIRVELDRRELTVTRSDLEKPPVCASCTRRLDMLTYALSGRTLCAFCARRDVS